MLLHNFSHLKMDHRVSPHFCMVLCRTVDMWLFWQFFIYFFWLMFGQNSVLTNGVTTYSNLTLMTWQCMLFTVKLSKIVAKRGKSYVMLKITSYAHLCICAFLIIARDKQLKICFVWSMTLSWWYCWWQYVTAFLGSLITLCSNSRKRLNFFSYQRINNININIINCQKRDQIRVWE